MKDLRKIGIAGSVLLVASMLLFRSSNEPRYQGRTLMGWLKKREADSSVAGAIECDRAIRQFGTNGILTLFRLLRTKDHPGTVQLEYLLQRCGINNSHLFDAEYKHRLASLGFAALGDQAASATPKLVELARNDPNPGTRMYALWCLEEIRADKGVLLPALTQGLKDSNQDVAKYAAQRLVLLYPNATNNAVGFGNGSAVTAPASASVPVDTTGR